MNAGLLYKQYLKLKRKFWDCCLWNSSYFVAIVDENKEEQIRDY
ncbi:MAG TPA: hypothetical protein GXX37_13575 [Clostridiaceae bacterium]|nr:hypothetical protein [Clostridiaceae bacterium]